MHKSINDLCREAHEIAKANGWWDREVPFPTFIANQHAEVSEAFDAYAHGADPLGVTYGDPVCGVNGGPCIECNHSCGSIIVNPQGIPVEIADEIIRIFDWCGKHGIDLERIIEEKMAYNRTRGYRHGGKVV